MPARAALEKLCRWRSLFAGWQLGTRSITDPESNAVRDHREVTICLRAEVNALVGLLIRKGAFTQDEWVAQLAAEAMALDKEYEARFPGFSTTDVGLKMSLPEAAETMKGWKP